MSDKSIDRREAEAARLMKGISDELLTDENTKAIGNDIWSLMRDFREAFRTARRIQNRKTS